jgi:hypothetical protein
VTLDEIIAMVRVEANLPLAKGRVSDTEIVHYVNRGKDFLAPDIIRVDQKYFEADDTISFVAGQEEYDIPRIFKDQRITLVERLSPDGSVAGRLTYYRFQEKECWESPAVFGVASVGRSYYLRDRKIGFKPRPTGNETNAVRVYGIQIPHDLLVNTIPAGSLDDTHFVIDNTANVVKGRVRTETDYYKNAVLRVIDGPDTGLERRITAFNPASRLATIDVAWTTGNVTGRQFILLSKIPDEYHHALVKFAVAQIAAKTPDTTLYELAIGAFRGVQDNLKRTIPLRRMDDSPKVHYRADPDELG